MLNVIRPFYDKIRIYVNNRKILDTMLQSTGEVQGRKKIVGKGPPRKGMLGNGKKKYIILR